MNGGTDNDALVQKCMDIYGVKTVAALAERTNIPYTTLNPWNIKGPSRIGTLLLNSLIENYELRKSAEEMIKAETVRIESIERIKHILGQKPAE